MRDEDTFLQAVQAEPANEQVRLVYADWLEERGDMRAELIRVMQEMAALPVYSDRHAQLRPRRDELRAKADKGWLERMGYVPTHRPMFTQLPERRVERWRLVEEFIGTWYRPLQPGDGATEEELQEWEKRLGFRLPAALREWHALAGKRKEVWSAHDRLVPLEDLRLDEGAGLVIYTEKEYGELWGVRNRDLELEDPPVYRCFEDPPGRASPTLTAFAIRVLLYGIPYSNNLRACLEPGSSGFREVSRMFPRCPLPEHFGVDVLPVRIYEGTDLILQAVGRWGFSVTARTETAYEQLSPRLREQLERFH
ncbi:MAG: TIGR02996 domain-containing protein [Gemmataceae bacterium]|nr:TIGR02996 domain-containing protein [Gemmataceae bacterium]